MEVKGKTLIDMMQGKQIRGYPSAECCWAAELYLLEKAQKGPTVKEAKMLSTGVLTEDVLRVNTGNLFSLGQEQETGFQKSPGHPNWLF